ncbi:anthranilate synthase component I family protein [Frigoribacterium faeni]|uniref:anthranilate synthase component I family protein n=1 Tax=Frigoribacterium faeni TaxID=145483 RepID=UPI00141B4AD6|nr:anthranilate synthase component I family protein [Frigoribacterium faeni]NIJ03844.1 anthranilate synthase component 1 [Frigoribacterium faeni]
MRLPVHRRPLPWRDPEAVVVALGGQGDVSWDDAGPGASTGRSVVAWGPALTASGPDELPAAWAELRAVLADGRTDADPLGPTGWLGYGVGTWLLDRDATVGAGRGAPPSVTAGLVVDPDGPADLALLLADRALVFDHGARTVEAVVLGDDRWLSDVARAWHDVAEVVAVDADASASAPSLDGPRRARRQHDDAAYLALVARCQRAIADGDAYVLCLTTTMTVEGDLDDLAVYRRLRRSSPAPHASFVRVGPTAVLGASPESFLRVDVDGAVSSSPIKGTRPRSSDPGTDAAAAAELRANEKELAENLMIVDLVRNDLTRVAAPGTVAVTELFAVRSYRHVHQLVSTVSAVLAPGRTALDAVETTFPAGSMTGAPKRRAVELLAGWEGRPRGVYAGAVGRFGLDGSASLAMAIRSVVVERATPRRPARATVGVGGGVTASSVPSHELEEALLKAAALLRVLDAVP